MNIMNFIYFKWIYSLYSFHIFIIFIIYHSLIIFIIFIYIHIYINWASGWNQFMCSQNTHYCNYILICFITSLLSWLICCSVWTIIWNYTFPSYLESSMVINSSNSLYILTYFSLSLEWCFDPWLSHRLLFIL